MTQYRKAQHLPQPIFFCYGTSVGFRDEAYAFGSSRHMLYVFVAVRHHRTEHGNCKHTSKKVIGMFNVKDALVLGANDTVQRGAPFASTHFLATARLSAFGTKVMRLEAPVTCYTCW